MKRNPNSRCQVSNLVSQKDCFGLGDADSAFEYLIAAFNKKSAWLPERRKSRCGSYPCLCLLRYLMLHLNCFG